jgi:hypothetical protein
VDGSACLRAASRLLLVLVAFGVLGMHTTGYVGSSIDTQPATNIRTVPGSAVISVDLAAAAPASTDQTAANCGCGGMCMDPSNACVAVLKKFDLPILDAALLFVVGRVAGAVASIRYVAVVAPRGPPPRWPIGLALADLSVLRR